VRHDEGASVLIYAQLEEGTLIDVGEAVVQGQPLAQAGDSGGQEAIHLHIELRDGGLCDDELHGLCGDIGWAGNPLGWESGALYIDGYRISGYCAVRRESDVAACFKLPSSSYYAYDGAAYRGVSSKLEDALWFDDIDEQGRSRRVRAAVLGQSDFDCPARGDCEASADPRFMHFAGHGLFGAGSELVSTNRVPDSLLTEERALTVDSEPLPTAPPPDGPIAHVAIQRGAGLFLLDTVTGKEKVILEVEELRDAFSPLTLSWSPEGSRLAFATAGESGAAITLVSFDIEGYVADWEEIPFGPGSSPLVAFDAADADTLFYAVVDPATPAAADLYVYSISTGIETWLYRTPASLPCAPFKMVALAEDRFILLMLCNEGQGYMLRALEVNKRAGTFQAAWLDDWFTGYEFLEQPSACRGNAPQIFDVAWEPDAALLSFVLSPDCVDGAGTEWSGSEEVAQLRPVDARPRPRRVVASEGITRVSTGRGGIFYRTDDGSLWWMAAADAPIALLADDMDVMAQRPPAHGNAPISEDPGEGQGGDEWEVINLSLLAQPSASSSLPSDRYGEYGPAQAVDGSLSTAWAEGAAGDGVGEWLLLDFGRAVAIDHLEISAGYDSSAASFAANNRVARATATFDDGRSFSFDLDDLRGLQQIAVPYMEIGQGTVTRSLRVTIDAVHPGATFDDTCIAELQVWGLLLEE
jgi:hypothetical protein